jgi:hypothetical protein
MVTVGVFTYWVPNRLFWYSAALYTDHPSVPAISVLLTPILLTKTGESMQNRPIRLNTIELPALTCDVISTYIARSGRTCVTHQIWFKCTTGT